MKTKTQYCRFQWMFSELPSFSKTGSIKGMKDKFYGKDALLVRCGAYIYNCTSKPELYNQAY